MTDWTYEFTKAHPRAVDFSESEYEADKANADAAARSGGYRLAGMRLGRAVFTTKPIPQQETPT